MGGNREAWDKYKTAASMSQLIKVIRLALKLAWLQLVIIWYSAFNRALLAGWFNWLGSRWHIRKGARMMGLRQQPSEDWDDFVRRVLETHRAETGIDINALVKAEIERRRV